MRGFIILICFAVASGEKVGHTHYGSSGSYHRFRYKGADILPPSTSAPGFASGINNGPGGFVANTDSAEQYESVESQSELNKEFFTYSAPDEEFNDIEAAQRLAATIRKNLRIVFIRAPENNIATNAALALAKQSAESKTSIYVLSKQTDYADLANKLQTIKKEQSEKPEVHFVKYRTPEDAVRAQQIIQNEYEALGGSSRVSNEGIAPVLDFASRNELPGEKRKNGSLRHTSNGNRSSRGHV